MVDVNVQFPVSLTVDQMDPWLLWHCYHVHFCVQLHVRLEMLQFRQYHVVSHQMWAGLHPKQTSSPCTSSEVQKMSQKQYVWKLYFFAGIFYHLLLEIRKAPCTLQTGIDD